MANARLIEARRRARLSQAGLARAIRHAGWQRGMPNGCTRELVHKWEHGLVRRPQAHHLLLLEDVLGQPADSLGFDADLQLGMDRAQALSEAGLDRMFPLPDAGGHGPLTGIWLSRYQFTSSGRNATYASSHYVMALQYGARLMIRSLPASASQVSMDMTVNGQVITGTWTERTRADGYYRGAVYTGALQMLETGPGELDGTWVGFGKGGEINTGRWWLTRMDESVTEETARSWDRPLPDR